MQEPGSVGLKVKNKNGGMGFGAGGEDDDEESKSFIEDSFSAAAGFLENTDRSQEKVVPTRAAKTPKMKKSLFTRPG